MSKKKIAKEIEKLKKQAKEAKKKKNIALYNQLQMIIYDLQLRLKD